MVFENKLGPRLVAFIIDLLCLQILSSFLINLGLGVEYNVFGLVIEELPYWTNLLLYLIYFVGFGVFNNSATIGKMILGLKVLQSDYEKLPESKRLLREVLKAVFMPFSIISFIVAIISAENKSIHDLIFDSVVVRERNYVQNPYNSNNVNKPEKQSDHIKDFNTPNDEIYYDEPVKKEYIDPLDENYKIDDDDY
jgi:uncharacterized RDD family membrane protein YckC